MANSQIKGISIEIGGNTVGLTKALTDVNRQTNAMKSELREVDRLLKLDPKNTELLSQKQKLLADSINATKDKLKTLKDAEAQAQEQFKKGEISEEQYRQLQREIVKTEQELKKLEKEAKTTGSSIEKIGDSANKFGEKVKGASKVAAGALVAVAGGSLKAYNDVHKGEENVIKATGAVGEEAEKLKDSFKDVAKSVPQDLDSVGSAIGEVNTRFGFTGKSLEDCTQQFLKFAEINNTDVTTSVQLVSRAMGDAGIDSSEYNSVLDALTKATQASGISIDKLTENVTKYGAPMRALGFTTQESISIFASWEKAGVNTEIAFSGMKKAISNWSSSGKDAKVEFKKTLDEIAKTPDIASATTKAIEVFGQKAGPDLADAIRGGRFEYDDFLKLIEGSKGTVTDTYAGIEDGGDKMKTSFNKLKVSASELGGKIMSVLAPALSGIIGAISKVVDWFSKLSPWVQGAIGGAVGLVAVLYPVSKAIHGVTKVIGGVADVIKGLATKVIPMLSGAFSFLAANPIVLIIGAIAAVVAIIAVLWTKCEWFRDAVTGVWDWIKGVFQGFLDWLNSIFSTDWSEKFGFFGDILNGFLTNIKNIWNSIKGVFQGVIDFIKNVFTGNWSGAWEAVKTIFSNIFGGLVSIVKSPINGIIGLLNSAISGINWMINGINKISFDMPSWLGGAHIGFNIGTIGKIPYLAKGGILESGSAIVGEAGAELLQVQNGKAKVTPLNDPKSKAFSPATGGGISLNIENFNNYRPQDVKSFANELNYYYRNAQLAKGGS